MNTQTIPTQNSYGKLAEAFFWRENVNFKYEYGIDIPDNGIGIFRMEEAPLLGQRRVWLKFSTGHTLTCWAYKIEPM
jgi:hypothetical protein